MSVFSDVLSALDQRLSTLTDAPPIAWQNITYEPVDGTLWIRPTLLPADTIGATLSTSGTDEQKGLYVVDVFAPAFEGKNEALAIADAVADHFKPVTELTYNTRLVRCISVSIGAPTNVDNWYQVPILINYLAHTAKR